MLPAGMRTPRSTLLVSCAALFVLGVLSGALGPLLPALAARAGVHVEAMGSVFSALFLGAFGTQLAGGWLNERFGLRNMLVSGAVLMTLGIAGVAIGPTLPLILAGAFLAGAGQGALDISTNVLIAIVFDARHVVSAVNIMHFAFGAGAVASPLVAAWALERWGSPVPVLWVGVALGAVTSLLAARHVMSARPAQPEAGAPGHAAVYRSPALWSLGFLLFVYVGVEMGVGGWTSVYLGRTTALTSRLSALVVSGYWLALTAGRLLGAALGARVPARTLAAVSLCGSSAGGLVLLAGGGSAALTIVGTLLLGLSFGPIFPTVVVFATELFRSSPSRAVSVVVSMSSIGGTLLPPLQGVLLERVSPLASVVQVAACALLMLALLAMAQRGNERSRRAPALPA
jgi:fucose permease